METTTLLAFFLLFVAAALILNTALIWIAGRTIKNLTMKVTGMVREFETSSETRQWLASLMDASEQAVSATEMTKRKMFELEPVLQQAHARHGFLLAQIDTKIDRLTTNVSEGATCIRDACSKPAEKFAAYAGNVRNILGLFFTSADK